MAVRLGRAELSRSAILDAAQTLFAERGYEGTTMADIGAGAGLSRATPAYFFGSKEDLYRAVLGRIFSETTEIIARTMHDDNPEKGLENLLSTYIDFLAANPEYIALVQRDALAGGRFLAGLPENLAALAEAFSALEDFEAYDLGPPEEMPQVLISIIGLCWFPFSNPQLVKALGLDARSPDFISQRKRHLLRLFLRSLHGNERKHPRPR